MRKLTYEYVKEQIEKDGYKLLSTEYINWKTKMKIKCLNNHIFYISWNNFKTGKRCVKCKVESHKLTYKFIKKHIESNGYKLLSTKYIDSKTKIKLQCPEGHIYKASWNSFNSGQRCSICNFNSQKLTYEFVKKQIETEGYKLLSTKYINSRKKLKIQCPKGHIYYTTWNCFKRGSRCYECYILSISGSNNYMWKDYTTKELTKLYNYRNKINQDTRINYKKYYKLINPNNLKRGKHEYHLDHIYSIMSGFKNNIPAKYISNPYNLQMLTEFENISKHDNCWQNKEELYIGYFKFINELSNIKRSNDTYARVNG